MKFDPTKTKYIHFFTQKTTLNSVKEGNLSLSITSLLRYHQTTTFQAMITVSYKCAEIREAKESNVFLLFVNTSSVSFPSPNKFFNFLCSYVRIHLLTFQHQHANQSKMIHSVVVHKQWMELKIHSVELPGWLNIINIKKFVLKQTFWKKLYNMKCLTTKKQQKTTIHTDVE